MSISFVIDTDVVIDIQHQHATAIAWFSTIDLLDAGLPVYVALELIQDARNKVEASASSRFAGMFTLAAPDETFLKWSVRRFADFHLSHGTGLVDILIAATALTHDVPLFTLNVRHYRHIPGLKVVQPYLK